MPAKVKHDRGAWWIHTHHAGRRVKQRIGPTKADMRVAAEIAKKVNAAIALGQYRPKPATEERPLPCAAVLRAWLDTYSVGFKPSYERSARGVVENHLIPSFGAMDLREIRESHLLVFVREKLEAGLRPNTVRNALSILRRVMNLEIREGTMVRNSASRIGELMRRVDGRAAAGIQVADAWTRDELRTLLDVAWELEPRFAPVLALLMQTGMRAGEALGLEWADVDFSRQRLHVRRSWVAGNIGTPNPAGAVSWSWRPTWAAC